MSSDHIQGLEDYCSPSKESLTLEGLHQKLSHTPSTSLACSHFLHELCLHPNVTLEMVELVLQFSPYAAYFCTNRYHGREVDPNDIQDYADNQAVVPHSQMELMSDRSYPVHVACANPNCPGDVICLLARSNPSALGHFCLLEEGCEPSYSFVPVMGLPIHYYFARCQNVHLDTIKILVEEFPACLEEFGANNEKKYHPIHALLENVKGGVTVNVLQYLIEKNPDILKTKDSKSKLPIHIALKNEGVTIEVIKFLIESWPDCAFHRDKKNYQFPLHALLETPKWNSNNTGILRLLVDAYPEAVQKKDAELRLAFHYACECGTIETVKYLYERYPECIAAQDFKGLSPVHLASAHPHDPDLKVLKFILDFDPEGASRDAKPEPDENQLWRYNGYFPLHYASEDHGQMYSFMGATKGGMEAIKYLFDVYPEALFKKTRWRSHMDLTPQKVAEISGYTEAFNFLSQQVERLTKYRNDPFPLHSAIKDNCTLGVIKLLCTEHFEDDTSQTDTSKNFQLHHACRKGKGKIEQSANVKYPIMLFLEMYECDNKDSLEYIGVIWQLLVANPNVIKVACDNFV